MRRLVFALFDTAGYMEALSEYLGRQNSLPESHLFTRQESLTKYLEEHKVDVLLLGEEVATDELRCPEQAESIIIMTEEEGRAEEEPYPMIFKYQSAEHVLEEIYRIAGETEGLLPKEPEEPSSQTEFIGVCKLYGEMPSMEQIFSIDKGCGKKTLFLDFELLNGLENSKKGGKGVGLQGMSEVIFYLKQRNRKLSGKLPAIIRSGEEDYISSVSDYRDLYSLSREDIDVLLSVLSHETGYGQVVFVIGYLHDSSLYLLSCCDRIYMPEAQNRWEENQKNSLEELICREGFGETAGNICYLPP